MLMCLLMLVMLLARVFAGTYADETQESESLPNYSETQVLAEEPEQVYTRTIVRPVSYSFLSASIQPGLSQVTEETTTYISENLDDAQQNGQPERTKLVFGHRTVLPGNFDSLQNADYGLVDQGTKILASSPDETKFRPVLKASYNAKPAQLQSSVTSAPKNNFRPHFRPQINQVYENKGKRRFGSSIYLGRGLPHRFLPPIPEVTLQPPPPNPNFLLAPRNHIVQPTAHDVEEKSSSNSERRNLAPKTQQPIVSQEAEELDEDLPYENVLPLPPKEDQKESESEHKKKPKKKKEIKESSEGSDHDEHEKSVTGEKGDKGYKKSSHHEKAEKGHHDKESHSGEYHDEHGAEKKHHKGEGYYGEHHKQEKGKKGKKYGEGKKHKKGHSTHGEHNIVKKNEYIKTTKFYDEDHDDGNALEHGEYHGQHAEKEGAKKEGGQKKKGYHKEETGKKGHHDKGHHEEEHNGFDKEEGVEDFYGNKEEHTEKKGNKHSKKWKKE